MTNWFVGSRQPTSILLDTELLAEAQAIGVNVSAAAEKGISEAIIAARQWKIDNKAAIESCNEFIEREGLPLAKYRRF